MHIDASTPAIPSELLELKDLVDEFVDENPELVDTRRSFGGLFLEGDDGAGDGDGGKDGGDDGKDGGKDDGKDGKDDGDAGDGDAAEERARKAEKAAADANKELRELKRQNEQRDREARESEGKFEELYKSEKERADKAEQALEDYKAEVETERTTSQAKSLAIAALKAAGVKNPERDVVHVDLSKVDSEAAAKRLATKFADANPDLLDKPPTRQKRGGGNDDGDDGGDEGKRGKQPMGPDRLRRHFSASKG